MVSAWSKEEKFFGRANSFTAAGNPPFFPFFDPCASFHFFGKWHLSPSSRHVGLQPSPPSLWTPSHARAFLRRKSEFLRRRGNPERTLPLEDFLGGIAWPLLRHTKLISVRLPRKECLLLPAYPGFLLKTKGVRSRLRSASSVSLPLLREVLSPSTCVSSNFFFGPLDPKQFWF